MIKLYKRIKNEIKIISLRLLHVLFFSEINVTIYSLISLKIKPSLSLNDRRRIPLKDPTCDSVKKVVTERRIITRKVMRTVIIIKEKYSMEFAPALSAVLFERMYVVYVIFNNARELRL